MNIQPINTIIKSQTFRANLYYQKRNLSNKSCGNTQVADCGAKNTDIFVSDIKKGNKKGNSLRDIFFTLKSPIFGECSFKTESQYFDQDWDGKDSDTIDNYIVSVFTQIQTCEEYENAALRKRLLETIKHNAEYNLNNPKSKSEINAKKILNSILENADLEQAGISKKRIKELRKVARKLNNEIALYGAQSVIAQENKDN